MKMTRDDFLDRWVAWISKPEVFFWIVLFIPPLLMLGGGFQLFSASSVIFLVASFWFWARPEGFEWKNLKENLARVRIRLVRSILNPSGFSWYAIALVLGMTIGLFAWFADGVKEKNLWLALGALSYTSALVFAADVVLREVLKNRKSTRRYYVAWASTPNLGKVSYEKLKQLREHYRTRERILDALRKNAFELPNGESIERVNLLLPLAPLAREDFPIENFDLLIASDTELNPKDEKKQIPHIQKYWDFIEEMALLLKPGLHFRTKRVGVNGQSIKELVCVLNDEYGQDLETHSQDFIFNISSGTAAMTAATMLVALRGAAEAIFIRQDMETAPLWERIVSIRLHSVDVPGLFKDDVF